MSKQWVAFDMDEVLVNIRDKMQETLHYLTGSDIHWTEWSCYDLTKIYNATLPDIFEAFKEHNVLESAKVEPYVHDAIKHIKNSGYKTAIITARGWHEDGEYITRKFLKDNDIFVDELMVVKLGESKNDALSKLGNVEFFIDDHLDHIKNADIAGVVKTPIIMNRPWNDCQHPYRRVSNLKEFADLV